MMVSCCSLGIGGDEVGCPADAVFDGTVLVSEDGDALVGDVAVSSPPVNSNQTTSPSRPGAAGVTISMVVANAINTMWATAERTAYL
ncbi:hypothetical protein JCM19992_24330 [Thermostilla marina]